MKNFRIFLAPPDDVAEERRIALDVIDRISHERRLSNIGVLAGRFRLQP